MEQQLSLNPIAVALEKEEAYLPLLPQVRPIRAVVEIAREHFGKIPLAVASGGTKPVIEKVLRHLGIRELFAAVVTSEDVVKQKPAPDIFLEAALRIGVKPGFCRAYEDTDLASGNSFRGHAAVDVRQLIDQGVLSEKKYVDISFGLGHSEPDPSVGKIVSQHFSCSVPYESKRTGKQNAPCRLRFQQPIIGRNSSRFQSLIQERLGDVRPEECIRRFHWIRKNSPLKRRARAEGDFSVGRKKEAGGRYQLYRARRGVGEGQPGFASRNPGAQPRSGRLA
jgi:hypothetical protein